MGFPPAALLAAVKPAAMGCRTNVMFAPVSAWMAVAFSFQTA